MKSNKILVVTLSLPLFLSACSTVPEEEEVALSCQEPSGHHMYMKELTCPLDGEVFESLRLGTHSRYGTYFDLEPVSYMDFPAPVPVCPSNGFVIYKDDLDSAEVTAQQKVIETPDYKKRLGRNTSYHLFAYVAEKMNLEYDVWWLHLKSTWEADLCRRPDLYSDYVREVIKHTGLALQDLGPEDDMFWVTQRVRINAYRRLGDFEGAKSELDLLLSGHEGEVPERELNFLQQLGALIEAEDKGQKEIEFKN